MEININVDDETKKNCKIVGQSRALKSTKEAPIRAALFAKNSYAATLLQQKKFN